MYLPVDIPALLQGSSRTWIGCRTHQMGTCASQQAAHAGKGCEGGLAVRAQAPRTLVLCAGAQVMLTRNASSRRGLVNGARGVVERFSGTTNRQPVVRFASVRTSERACHGSGMP